MSAERKGTESERPTPDGTTPDGTRGALIVKTFHEEDAVDDEQDLSLLKRMMPFVLEHKVLFLAALALMPATSLVALLSPYLLKLAVDAAVIDHSQEDLTRVVFLYGLVLVGEFVGRFGQVYLMQLGGQRTMADLRRTVYAHIQRLPVRYFDRTPIGRVVTRVTNDVDSLSEFFASGAITVFADVVTLLGIIVFMLALDWRLSLVAFAALPPLALVVAIFRRYARSAFRDIRARIAQLNAYLAEQVQGVGVVQAFGREARCAKEYDRINRGYRDANYRAIRYDALLYSVVESVAVASIAVVLWYASSLAGLVDEESAAIAYVGTVVAFYEYIQRFFIPIRDLSTKYTIIQHSLASAERIFALLDIEDRDAPEHQVPPHEDAAEHEVADAPAIAVRDVTFAYRTGHPVLHDINLEVKRGETIAVVGATGSGKTTLTSLVLRLYELEQGTIELDGVDIRSFDRHELRRRFAVVPQDVFLFSGSILDNIALGVGQSDLARAEEALRQVGAWELVVERHGGLAGHVEERGSNFSLGERQLLAFARALYRDPQLLILDEATANIDSETEHQLQSAALQLISGRTALVIAHRLSTIRNADRIVVFHRGRIAEIGTHAELLALGGVYARLHDLQFGDPVSAPSVPPPA